MSTSTRDMTGEIEQFFDRYVAEFNAGLAAPGSAASATALYTDHFIGAHPGGVEPGENGAEFVKVMQAGFERYRSIGTKHMAVRGVEVTPIDDFHALARVQCRASYVRNSDQQPIDLDFQVAYLVQNLTPEQPDAWRVFAFVTGDERGEYERHGLTAG